MVLIESLDSFVEQAEALHKQNPLKSRYVIKYSHCKGKLTLKLTDDRNTVQYKTDQQSDLKKVHEVNCRRISYYDYSYLIFRYVRNINNCF